MMIGNYSYDDENQIPQLNLGDLDSFDQLRTGNFLLEPTLLQTINASSPIQQIRMFCHRPEGDKKAHFTTTMNEMGFRIRDSLIRMSGGLSDPDLHTGLESLSGDRGGLSKVATHSLDRGYFDHSIYQRAHVNMVLRAVSNRRNCDDQNSRKPGTWRFYIR